MTLLIYFLVILYISLEIASLLTTKMLLIHKLLILLRIYIQLKKLTPKHWKFKNVIYVFMAERKSKNTYSFYQEFYSLVKSEKSFSPFVFPKFTNDNIKINTFGKFISYSFVQQIESKDKLLESEVLEWKRDQKLKDLGF